MSTFQASPVEVEIGHPGAHSDRPASGWGRQLPLILAAIAVVVWAVGLRTVQAGELSGYGLLGALSPMTLAAYPLLLVADVWELSRAQRRSWVLAVMTFLLTFLVLGLQPLVESAGRLPVAWLHVGYTEQIASTGHTLGSFDARFSWPAFFSAAAFLAKAAGMSSPAPFLVWAPLVLGGLTVLACRALAAAVFGTRRAGWLATWIFLLANWTEQEYFSPQGVAMVVFVAALALTVRYLLRTPLVAPDGEPVVPTARDRVWAQILLVVLAAALAPTHQLTPYVLIGVLFLLVLSRRLIGGWKLAVAATVPTVVWFVVGAHDYWSGHLSTITSAIGHLDSSLKQGVGDRIAGNGGHHLMATGRLSITVVMAVAAAIGAVILLRAGFGRNVLLPLLAVLSFGLAVLQPYGGEVLIRSYLYALPWLAILAAVPVARLLGERITGVRAGEPAVTVPAARTARSWRVVTVASVTVLLSAVGLSTVAARGGNDAYVMATAADRTAMDYVYGHAATGDSVIALLWYVPLRSDRVSELTQAAADVYARKSPNCDTAGGIATCVARGGADWIVVNPQQEAGGEIVDGFPVGWMDQAVNTLVATYGYRVVFTAGGDQVLLAPSKG